MVSLSWLSLSFFLFEILTVLALLIVSFVLGKKKPWVRIMSYVASGVAVYMLTSSLLNIIFNFIFLYSI